MAEVTARRRLGAYYTPSDAAQFMADWVLRTPGETVLEPSFGKGVFLRALDLTINAKQLSNITVRGVELDPDVHRAALADGLLPGECARLADFLSVSMPPVSAAIGNPPYVRLRHLPADQRERALAVAARSMGQPMDPSGSVWMPFVLQACDLLRPGGRFAVVLPFDLTYVRYARPLWTYLGQRFGALRIVRVRERMFSDILQDTVILFGESKGRSTGHVQFDSYDTVHDLLAGDPSSAARIDLDDVISGDRPFLRALLAPELVRLLDGRLSSLTQRARESITFNIGYVAGDKEFFHPAAETAREFRIPESSLVSSVTTARRLNGHGLHTSDLEGVAVSRLFLPASDELSAGEAAYVAHGEANGVNERYKCRIREPWYRVPHVRVPDLVVSVFAERPLLLVNDAELIASNSLLCGYLRPGSSADAFASGWYTSLTLLQLELEVHSLGGGVFVLVPGEAGRIRLPRLENALPDVLAEVDGRLAMGDIAGAYDAGDEAVLRRSLGLSTSEIELIRAGVSRLSHWRRGAQGA